MKPQYQTNFKHHIQSDSCPYYNPNKDNHAMNSHHLHVPVNQVNSNIGNAKSFISKSSIQEQSKAGNLSGYLKPSIQNHNIPQIQGQKNIDYKTPQPVKNTPYIPITKFKQSHVPEMIKSSIHNKNYGIKNKVQKGVNKTSDGKDKQYTFYQPTIFSKKIPRISQTNGTQTPLKIIQGSVNILSNENKSNLLIKNRINQQELKQIPSFIKNKQKDSIPLIKYKRINTCQNQLIDTTMIEQKQEIKTKQFLIYPKQNIKYKNIKNENNKQIKLKQQQIKLYKIKKQHKFEINNFEIIKQLGYGKYGHVNLVRDKLSGFICALKIISKKLLQQQEIIEQLIRQLKIQIYLNHPNIIKMYGYFYDENYIYIILEAGTGGQLYHLLKKNNYNNNNNNNNNNTYCINQNKIVFIIKQICQAINEIHSQRIIHRDIKPQNIVLQDNVIKLCDFGWSVHQNNKLRQTFCGTPLYVCPEILKGNKYDQKIDIWSLGIMMYQILIGQNPFKINKEQQLVKIIKNQICIPNYVYVSFEAKDFLDKCLKKNPNQRASIRQLLQHQFFMKHPEKNDQKITTE